MYDVGLSCLPSFVLQAELQVAAQFLGKIDIPEIVLAGKEAFQHYVGY